MIIVEGPDGAGKTTLVNDLVERYGFKVGERGTSDRKLLYTVTRSDTYRAISGAVYGDSDPVIWDRLYYSEFVYASVVGRPVQFTPQDQKVIERLIWALNCPVIVCLPPLNVVKENALKEEQMDGVLDNLTTIWHAYDYELNRRWHKSATLWYDYTGSSRLASRHNFTGYKGICREIEAYLEERKEREVRGSIATTS